MPSRGSRATVPSKPRWVDTGILLTAGTTYRISAYGTWVDWLKKNTCGPTGYQSYSGLLRWAERFRLQPAEPWFALIGSIDRDPSAHFAIGASTTFTPAESGELSCFANDVPFFRWNNKGSVTVVVEPAGV